MRIVRRLRQQNLNGRDWFDLIDRDNADQVVGEESEPTRYDPTEAVAQTLNERADAALADLRTIATSTGTLTGAQLSNAVRVLARVGIALIRLELRRLDDTD
jgi:hypothetical protein